MKKPVNQFAFGKQTIKTKVHMMTYHENDEIPVDVVNYLPESDLDPFALPRSGAPDAAAAAFYTDLPSAKESKGKKLKKQ